MSDATPESENAFVVATWNVNSIRSRIQHVSDWLKQHRPAVLCLQETKVADDLFPIPPFEESGYLLSIAGQKSYNGVAIVSSLPIKDVVIGLPDDSDESPKRFIAATIAGVRIVNVYVPNGSEVGSEKFKYKLDFIVRLRKAVANSIKEHGPTLLAGDFNVAPEPRDVYDPAAFEGQILFHPEERRAFSGVMAVGMEDVYRIHHAESGRFTWWDYRMNAYQRKMGLRIDHIWATSDLARRSTRCEIDTVPRERERPSDHAPVLAAFTL